MHLYVLFVVVFHCAVCVLFGDVSCVFCDDFMLCIPMCLFCVCCVVDVGDVCVCVCCCCLVIELFDFVVYCCEFVFCIKARNVVNLLMYVRVFIVGVYLI